MNAGSSDPRRELVQSVEKWSRSLPDRVALVFDDGHVTFQELNQRGNRVANGLDHLGLQRGDRIALMLPNIPEFVYALLGILKLGAVAVPFNTMYKGGEILHILRDSGARALVALTNFVPMINEIRPELPALEHVITTGERNLLFADPEATLFLQVILSMEQLGGLDAGYQKMGGVLVDSLQSLGVGEAWYKHRGSVRVRGDKIATLVISEIEGTAVISGIVFKKPLDMKAFLRVVWIPPEVRDKVVEPLTSIEEETGREVHWEQAKDTLTAALENAFQVEIKKAPLMRDELFGYEKLRTLAYKAR
jgi:long-chain acyl-CoA synthetase